jgi:glutamine synthetase
MQREPIIFVGTSDLSGHFRGKSFPAADLPARLQRGVGLAPTNNSITAFGPIQVTTFGTQWLGADLFSAYVRFKRAEIAGLKSMDESEICRRYAEVY